MIIDCAFNEKLAEELAEYLMKSGFEITKQGEIIKSIDKNLTKDELELFLKRTNKIKVLQIIPSEKDVFIIATKIPIEGFGLARCSICGFVIYKEEIMAHERAHGVSLL
jgi:hypothetical protein